MAQAAKVTLRLLRMDRCTPPEIEHAQRSTQKQGSFEVQVDIR